MTTKAVKEDNNSNRRMIRFSTSREAKNLSIVMNGRDQDNLKSKAGKQKQKKGDRILYKFHRAEKRSSNTKDFKRRSLEEEFNHRCRKKK